MDTTAAQRPARLNAGVVGVGRVGAVLGAALAAAGHRVVAASAVSEASRTTGRRAAARRCDPYAARGPGPRRPGVAHGPRRRARRAHPRPGRHRRRTPRPAPGPHQRTLRGRCARRRHPGRRPPVGPASRDDLHRHLGGPVPTGRLLVRRDRARAVAPGRRGAGGGDGRRAAVGRRGAPRALPRRAGQRRQPPGHPGRVLQRPAAPVRGGQPRRSCSARCSAPRWTTRCAPATRP